MADLKQLKYFIVCAKAGSFSEAAKLLYTTQPSVSKAIKALEDSMGVPLFERLPRGISLTARGREVYRYACRIMKDVDILDEMSKERMTKWLRISLNPSSWFANRFVEFYNQNYEKNYHFQIYTAGVRTVMERVRDYLDDLGFVYIMEQQKEEFLYELAKNGLVFHPMQEIASRFYPGRKNPMYAQKDGCGGVSLEQLKGIRFIQNYQDEFLNLGEKDRPDIFSWEGLDIAVLTNSDYIMERMLRESNVANISGSYLSKDQKEAEHGIPLDFPKNKVVFGYVMHKGEEPDKELAELIGFLEEKLQRDDPQEP